LEKIGSEAFESSGLESVTIPDSVVYISSGAFSGCRNLKTVTIGSGIKGIGAIAFEYCSSLTTFNIGVEKLEKKINEWGGLILKVTSPVIMVMVMSSFSGKTSLKAVLHSV